MAAVATDPTKVACGAYIAQAEHHARLALQALELARAFTPAETSSTVRMLEALMGDHADALGVLAERLS